MGEFFTMDHHDFKILYVSGHPLKSNSSHLSDLDSLSVEGIGYDWAQSNHSATVKLDNVRNDYSGVLIRDAALPPGPRLWGAGIDTGRVIPQKSTDAWTIAEFLNVASHAKSKGLPLVVLAYEDDIQIARRTGADHVFDIRTPYHEWSPRAIELFSAQRV
jgi:hypothetical protein